MGHPHASNTLNVCCRISIAVSRPITRTGTENVWASSSTADCVNISITVLATSAAKAGHSTDQGPYPGARADEFEQCTERDGEDISTETWAMPATPLTLGWQGLCLGPFYLLLPWSPQKQEFWGVSFLVFSMIHNWEHDISTVCIM